MTAFEGISLMIMFGMLVISILSFKDEDKK
ncbi:putative holin-like toxin [Halalkalibacter sp. APA_J-10(15)]|nr:putative holin-like toxin [Halalkalibacter sp. APA_J-10(15)]MCK0470178.1 putative holin-like toxin [Halalkalibacter sp. APA_J-10(15)]